MLYLYLAAPYKQIGFFCKVREVGLTFEEALPHIRQLFKEKIDHKRKPKTFMRLDKTVAIPIANGSPLSYDLLKRHGLNGMLMGPRKLENNPRLLEYVKKVCNEI